MNVENINLKLPKENELHLTDKWILSKLNNIIEKINQQYTDYKLNEVIKTIYEFVYDYFCDWYLEFTKTRFYGNDSDDKQIAAAVSVSVLKDILKLLHPFTPHITEEIWSFLNQNQKKLLINNQIAISKQSLINNEIESDINLIIQTITIIRNVKANLNIPPGQTIALHIRGEKEKTHVIEKHINLLSRIAKVEKIIAGGKIAKPKQAATGVIGNLEIFIPLSGLINIEKEIIRLQKQVDDMNGRLNAIYKKLDNKNFIDRAPQDIIKHEQNKKNDYELKLEKLNDNLSSLIE